MLPLVANRQDEGHCSTVLPCSGCWHCVRQHKQPSRVNPLGPAFGCADADPGQVSTDRGGQFSGEGKPGGIAAGVGVDALTLKPDIQENIPGGADKALSGNSQGPGALSLDSPVKIHGFAGI